jgi:hypothetical protein
MTPVSEALNRGSGRPSEVRYLPDKASRFGRSGVAGPRGDGPAGGGDGMLFSVGSELVPTTAGSISAMTR